MNVITKPIKLHSGNSYNLKIVKENNFEFNYGYIELKTRSWLDKPVETLIFDMVINVDVTYKVKNYAGDTYFQLFIMYKEWDEEKQQYEDKHWKGDLKNWKLKIIYKGDMGINI